MPPKNRVERDNGSKLRETPTAESRTAMVAERHHSSSVNRTSLDAHSAQGYAPARSTVVVCESVEGHLEIRYRDRAMRWIDITASAAARVQAVQPIARPPSHAATMPRRRYHRRQITQGANIVISRGRRFGRCATDEALVEAFGAVDAKNARPPLLGNDRTVSTSFHRHFRHLEGDIFYRVENGDISIES